MKHFSTVYTPPAWLVISAHIARSWPAPPVRDATPAVTSVVQCSFSLRPGLGNGLSTILPAWLQ